MPIRALWRRTKLVLTYILLFVVIVWVVHWEYVPPGSFGAQLDRLLRGTYFDFVQWEAEALIDKFQQELTGPQRYLDEATRKRVVMDYLDLLARIQQLQWEISVTYADPDIADPEAASASERGRLEQLQAEQDAIRGTAEAILEEQISGVLADEGFAILGQVLPPVRFHFTPLPNFLVVSPRSEIRMSHGSMLRGDVAVDRQEEIESQIDETLDVSSLVVPIGGLAVYPAMLYETSDLSWGIGAMTHEWVHHYYFFWLKPVGLYYDSRPDVRTINETAADLAGEAIKEKVLARYYPELLPPPATTADPEVPPTPTPEPPEFDFVAEMRETRISVDELLAEGKIEEAEAYMERRRHVFVGQGYSIRKLNQAYFAFYGAYASEPGGGAAGSNPLGNPVQELWAASPSVKAFLDALGPITGREALLALLAEKGIAYPPPTSPSSGQN